MESEEDYSWYQCKLCPGKFKTTAELQKHKRLSHRNPTKLSGQVTVTNNLTNVTPVTSPPTPNQVNRIIDSDPTSGHGHGTRYSKTKNTNSQGGTIGFGQRRHLTCASCGHNFDTKDPVVLHLLRQSRNDNGSLKCPFCAKMLLEGNSLFATVPTIAQQSLLEKKISDKKFLRKSDIEERTGSAEVSRSSRRKSGNGNGGGAKPIHVNSYLCAGGVSKRSVMYPTESSNASSSSTLTAQQPSLRLQKKRKLSSPPESSKPSVKKANNFKLGQNESSSSDSNLVTASTASSTSTEVGVLSPALFSGGANHISATSTPLVPMQSDQLKRQFEVTYRQPRGKGSRGGIGRRRSSGLDKSCTTVEDSSSMNSADASLKVSVLINNNPYPSATRLAVPKGKHFQKGDIRCPYCGFEAKSLREVQFHVNTHMRKSYPCEFCSHIYRSKQAVIKHTEKHHPNESSKIKAKPDGTNNCKDIEEDQQSTSNYSFISFPSPGNDADIGNDSYEISQDSNTENNNGFPVTTTVTSFCASETQNVSFHDQQAYFSSTGNALLADQQGRDIFLEGEKLGSAGGSMEKVLEISEACLGLVMRMNNDDYNNINLASS